MTFSTPPKSPQGGTMPVLLHQAEQSERLIVTADKDFGHLIFRDRLNSHGVVLIRMHRLTLRERLARRRSGQL